MIKVLASGSKGNCYLIKAKDETLILECGISWKEILKGLNFDLRSVVGCLVTHSHKDHCKSLKDVVKNGIRVFGAIEETDRNIFKVETNLFRIGGFRIQTFKTEHDVESIGFLIGHKEIGKVLFVTDTYYLKYRFDNIDHILIECNYSEELIKDIQPYQARLFKSHMSLETLKETLSTWDLSNTKDITLIHLSSRHSDEELFKNEIEKLTGKPVYIAEEGVEL